MKALTPLKEQELVVTINKKLNRKEPVPFFVRDFHFDDASRPDLHYGALMLIDDKLAHKYGVEAGEIKVIELPQEDPDQKICFLMDTWLTAVMMEDIEFLAEIELLSRDFKLGIHLLDMDEWDEFLNIVRPKLASCNTFQEIDLLYARGIAVAARPTKLSDKATQKDICRLIGRIYELSYLLRLKFNVTVDDLMEAKSRTDNIRELALAMHGVINPNEIDLVASIS